MLCKRNSLKVLAALSAGILLAAVPAGAQADRAITKLAEGVYELEHGRVGGMNAGGNTTVIIGERQVLVVDSCFLPSAAREDIAQIRRWTDKPVAFVLNTHFHNDHNFGNRLYMDAFPGVSIIAQVETKKDMDMFGPGSLRREEQDSYGIMQTLKAMQQTGKTKEGHDLTAEEKAEVKDMLSARPLIMEDL